MDNTNYAEVGKRIALCRKQKKLTLDEVGFMLGVNRSTIQRYESGQTKRIRLAILEQLANALDTTPYYLMTGLTKKENSQKEEAQKEETLNENSSQIQYTLEQPDSETNEQSETSNSLNFFFNGENLIDAYSHFNTINGEECGSYELHSSINYTPQQDVHVDIASDNLSDFLSDDEIIERKSYDTLPNVFGYLVYTEELSPRIIQGDYLTIRVTDRASNGDLCMFITPDNLITFRRVYFSSLGIMLTSEYNRAQPIMLTGLGQEEGFTLVGRVAHLCAVL